MPAVNVYTFSRCSYTSIQNLQYLLMGYVYLFKTYIFIKFAMLAINAYTFSRCIQNLQWLLLRYIYIFKLYIFIKFTMPFIQVCICFHIIHLHKTYNGDYWGIYTFSRYTSLQNLLALIIYICFQNILYKTYIACCHYIYIYNVFETPSFCSVYIIK